MEKPVLRTGPMASCTAEPPGSSKKKHPQTLVAQCQNLRRGDPDSIVLNTQDIGD